MNTPFLNKLNKFRMHKLPKCLFSFLFFILMYRNFSSALNITEIVKYQKKCLTLFLLLILLHMNLNLKNVLKVQMLHNFNV